MGETCIAAAFGRLEISGIAYRMTYVGPLYVVSFGGYVQKNHFVPFSDFDL